MRRTITCLILILSLLLSTGCSSQIYMNQLKDSIIYSRFDKTLSNYYFEENDSISLSLYSFSEKVSPIKTVALYTLLGDKTLDISNYNEIHNKYYFSYQKSLYLDENYIDINKLNEKSTQFDFYLAIKVATTIKNNELLNQIRIKYDKYKIESSSYSEKIYKKINESYLNDEKLEYDNLIEDYFQDIEVNVRFDVEGIMDLNASILYIEGAKMDISKKSLEYIFNIMIDENNQMYIMSQPDIIVSLYMENLSLLSSLLGNKGLSETFFSKFKSDNSICHESVIYDINSLKNLALYTTALYYSDEKVTKQLYNTLQDVLNQLKVTISEDNYSAVFYYNYVCSRLGIEDKIDINYDEKKELSIDDSYYYIKSNGILLEKRELNSEDILYHLLYLDVCEDEKYVESIIKDINIFEYKDEDDFPFMLNLYTSIMLRFDSILKKEKNSIITFIESKENLYGYVDDNKNYNFETSVYYTNILNMLEGSGDCGLR